MKFSQTMKLTKPDLVVSMRHEQWLGRNSNPEYSLEAIDFGRKALFDQGMPRDRRGTYSASSLNSCVRRQQFTFLGMPEIPPTPKQAGIFQNGTFMHIRWQMAGLTEGWLRQAEVPVPSNSMNLAGTQDGVAHEDSVVELKSINSYGFGSVNTFGVKPDHVQQVGTYMAATGAEKSVVIYEDKNTQEFREFVVTIKDVPVKEIQERADRLWEMTEKKSLAEPLDKCLAGEGFQFTGCPFREVCMTTKSWEHAEEQA